MPPSLTYLAEHLVDRKPHTNLSWAITVTERVSLIAVEWYRQVYVQFKMWKLNSWIYEQFERLGGGTEVPEEKQRRSTFIGFDPWRNEYLQEGERERRF
eukprot:IDg11044t1